MKPLSPDALLPDSAGAFLQSLNRNQRGAYRGALATFQQFAEKNGSAKPGTPLPPKRLGRAIVSDFYSWLQERFKEPEIPVYLVAAEQYIGWLRQHRGFRARVWPPAVLPGHGDRFLRESAGEIKSKSHVSYRAALLNFQRFAQEAGLTQVYVPLPPKPIAETILADYYSWLVSGKKSDATIRLYLAVTTLYLEWLDAEKKLPARVKILAIRTKLDAKTKRRLKPAKRGSDKALGRLLAYFDRQVAGPAGDTPSTGNEKLDEWFKQQSRLIALRNWALIHTLYSTAGRAAEVAALTCGIIKVESPEKARPATPADYRQPEQIQLLAEKRLLVSVVTAHRITGKGDVERTVVFTHEAQVAIEGYVSARMLIEGTLEPDRALFVSHARNMYHALTPQSIWRELSEASKIVFESSNRPGHIGPHAFRHLRAQYLSNEGMSIEVLQKYLGHANVDTTRSTYAPNTPDEVILDQVATYSKSAAEVIEEARESLL